MIFKGLEVSVTGMLAERIRMDVVSSNLANVNSTKAENGQPYTRKVPVFEAVLDKESGLTKVRVKEIKKDTDTPFRMKYDPTNPEADKNGYVKLPNVEPMKEMVDMMTAIRSYEANLTAFNTHKDMLLKSLEILRV